jgi:hypothetical protein
MKLLFCHLLVFGTFAVRIGEPIPMSPRFKEDENGAEIYIGSGEAEMSMNEPDMPEEMPNELAYMQLALWEEFA